MSSPDRIAIAERCVRNDTAAARKAAESLKRMRAARKPDCRRRWKSWRRRPLPKAMDRAARCRGGSGTRLKPCARFLTGSPRAAAQNDIILHGISPNRWPCRAGIIPKPRITASPYPIAVTIATHALPVGLQQDLGGKAGCNTTLAAHFSFESP